MRSRPNAFSKRAVVSSSSVQASSAGIQVMEAGGNLVDAAIATSAVLCVTQNNLCGLGGDAFVLLHKDGKPVIDLNGSGRAFSGSSIEMYSSRGLSVIPQRGPDAVITVPGLVRTWEDLHKNYCTMGAKELLKPAYLLARDGYPITQNYSESIEASFSSLSGYQGWRDTFAPNGRIPGPGTVFVQKDLANTLNVLMSDGFGSFYDGYLADRIEKGLKDSGVGITADDLRNHRSTFQEPLRTEYNDFEILETSPNSQAATVILWLNLLSGSEHPDKLEEVLRNGILAYSERNRHVTDPETHPLPDDFTDYSYAEKVRRSGRYDFPGNNSSPDGGDTTYFSITDSEMNSISMIQSNYKGFGTGIIPTGTGFVMQNRGVYFSLDPSHHNALKPGKRTFHTLCAGMLRKGDDFISSFGSMGGDIQPQVHMQLITGIMKNPLDPQSVLDKPRWAFPHTIYEKPDTFIVETETLEGEIRRVFPKKKINMLGFSSEFGHAQISTRLPGGIVVGGADPRGDGIALPLI